MILTLKVFMFSHLRSPPRRRVPGALALALGLGMSCSDEPTPPTSVGGDTTVSDRTSNAYRQPAPNLDDAALARHRDGDREFDATFVSAPATVQPGLGPQYNSPSCRRCHVRNGRGFPIASVTSPASSLVVMISAATGEPTVPGGPVPVPGLGTQLQDHATFGVSREATLFVTWIERAGRYGDGEPYTLRAPRVEIRLSSGRSLPGDVATSWRVPAPVFGLGLLEAIPADEVRAFADPDDRDGDGISGRTNEVWDLETAGPALGRFGWKAGVPTLRQQAAIAYAEHIGVTNAVMPAVDGSTELADDALAAVTFYTASLGVPAPGTAPASLRARGEARFADFGCADCHRPRWRTGDHPVAAVREQEIWPYTDLLLHNVGFELADGRPEFRASGTEWRTAPLWGLGLAQTVAPGVGLLHDGRARTIAEAILWHGGEAAAAAERFRTAASDDRAALLVFLGSL